MRRAVQPPSSPSAAPCARLHVFSTLTPAPHPPSPPAARGCPQKGATDMQFAPCVDCGGRAVFSGQRPDLSSAINDDVTAHLNSYRYRMSRFHTHPGAHMNLRALPELRAAKDPDRPAVADDNVSLTNSQFLEAVGRGGASLRRLGVSRGDVVAIMLPNTASFVVSLFAAWRLGAAVTPINPTLRPAEVQYQLADADAKVLIVDTVPEFETGGRQVVIASDLTAQPAYGVLYPTHLDEDALALLIYTSGTTGRPKGVMLDHANLTAMCRAVIDALEISAADHSLLILPLFHVNGIVIGTLSPLLAGGRMTIAGRFSPKTFFSHVEQSGATYFSAVPTIYTMLCGLPAEVAPDTSSVRFAICGAAPASVELLEQFQSRYGIPIIEGYGLSEGTCASTINPLDGPRKAGTVGLPLPGQTIRLVD